MVQGDDFPAVVEDGGAGRAGVGVGLVVEEVVLVVGELQDLVLPQRDLLELAHRVLDDRDALTGQNLVLDRRERVEAEVGELPAPRGRGLANRDQGEVEFAERAGHEKGVGVELEDHGRADGPFEVVLIVELDRALGRRAGRTQDVIIRQHEARGDEEPGPHAVVAAERGLDMDQPDGPRGELAGFEVFDLHQHVPADDPFQDGDLGVGNGLDLEGFIRRVARVRDVAGLGRRVTESAQPPFNRPRGILAKPPGVGCGGGGVGRGLVRLMGRDRKRLHASRTIGGPGEGLARPLGRRLQHGLQGALGGRRGGLRSRLLLRVHR